MKLAKTDTSNVVLKIGNEPLERVSTYKYLGMWIDENLNWASHIDKMSAKISRRLGLFRRIRHCLTPDTAKMSYNALVLPLFDYGNVIYSTCGSTMMRRLQVLQNRGMKITLQWPYRSHSEDMLKKLKWMSVKDRAEYSKLCLVYKCINDQAPNYLCSKFNSLKERHQHNTRNRKQNNLSLVKPRINQQKRAFSYSGASMWNNLDPATRNCDTLNSFKSCLKKSMFNLD